MTDDLTIVRCVRTGFRADPIRRPQKGCLRRQVSSVASPMVPSGLAPVLDRLTRFLSRLRPGPKARLAISFALLGLLLSQSDFAAVLQVLRNANPWLVLACVFLVAGGRILVAYRWHLLVRIANPAVGFGKLLRLTFVSIFLGFAAPGAVAAEVIRVYGLAHDTGLAFALSSVLIERLTAMSALVCLLLLGLMLGPLDLPQTLDLIAGAALGLILITLVTLFVPWLRALPLLLLPGSVLSPLRAGLESVLDADRSLRSRPITLVCVALLSIVLQVLRVLEIIALAAALDIKIDLVYFFVVVPIRTFLRSCRSRRAVSAFARAFTSGCSASSASTQPPPSLSRSSAS